MRHRKAWVDLADAAVPTGTSLPLSRNPWRLFVLSRRLLERRAQGPRQVQALGRGHRLWKRIGFKKAKIAVARKLAVILHRMWRDEIDFIWSSKEAAA